jgi:MFS transporter, putative metabolite:H+ symporter
MPPLLGILVIPNFAPDISWRIFLVIAGLPIVYVWVIIRYLPESPRWLSRVGRHDEAERIVSWFERRVEAATGRTLPEPVVAPEVILAVGVHRPVPTLAALGTVWRAPYLVRTLAMICGAVSTFSMFYVGVNYVPSLFLEKQMGIANALLFTLIITSVQIPGKILNGLIAERVGRKAVYLIYTIPAAIGAYEFGQSSNKYAMLG